MIGEQWLQNERVTTISYLRDGQVQINGIQYQLHFGYIG